MKTTETALPGVVELEPNRFDDDRGWFREVWNAETLRSAGLVFDWCQDNESLSRDMATVRGIHFQLAPHAQDKLVRVISGRVFDVAVDLRRSSPTFGKWVGVELDAERGNQLLIPRGFGHGFASLTENCRLAYKVSAHYNAAADRAIAWNDPAIGISWPVDTSVVRLSAKDRDAPLLADAVELFP